MKKFLCVIYLGFYVFSAQAGTGAFLEALRQEGVIVGNHLGSCPLAVIQDDIAAVADFMDRHAPGYQQAYAQAYKAAEADIRSYRYSDSSPAARLLRAYRSFILLERAGRNFGQSPICLITPHIIRNLIKEGGPRVSLFAVILERTVSGVSSESPPITEFRYQMRFQGLQKSDARGRNLFLASLGGDVELDRLASPVSSDSPGTYSHYQGDGYSTSYSSGNMHVIIRGNSQPGDLLGPGMYMGDPADNMY